jgi:tetratricopeptide (TPR) repeat protein
LEIQERIGDAYQMAMTCCNLGDLYCHTGDVEAGLACTQQGLETFRRVASPEGIIFALTVLATLHWRTEALGQARQELLEARGLVTEHQAREFQSAVGRWLAQIQLAEGNLAGAEAEIQALLTLPSDDLGLDAEPAHRLHGQLLARQGRLAEAQQALQDCLKRLEAKDEQYETAWARLALAEVLAARKDVGASRAQAEEALAIFKALGAKLDAAQAEKLLSGR